MTTSESMLEAATSAPPDIFIWLGKMENAIYCPLPRFLPCYRKDPKENDSGHLILGILWTALVLVGVGFFLCAYFLETQTVSSVVQPFISDDFPRERPKNATYEVVIAAFEANLDWAKDLSPPRLTVYLKGNALTSSLPPGASVIRLRNIGREAETLVYHVVHNYDTLAGFLIFLQGNPFGHMDVAGPVNPSPNPRNLQPEIDNLIAGQPIHPKTIPFCREWYTEPYDIYPELHLQKYYEIFFNDTSPEVFTFAPGCQYIFPRDEIRARPLAFYKSIHSKLKQRDNPTFHGGPLVQFDGEQINAWAFERFAPLFFNRHPALRDPWQPV